MLPEGYENLKQFQEAYAEGLRPVALKLLGRPLIPDGISGPVTKFALESRICNVPDFANAEEANIPDACRQDITISTNFNKFPGLSENETLHVWEHVKNIYNNLFDLSIILKFSDFPNTRIWATLKALWGPTLAWSFLANNSCAYKMEQAYDNTINWTLKLAKGVAAHEVGHAMGMNHTPNDPKSLMYPSINDQITLNETDIAQMVKLGYKRRSKPPIEPSKITATVRFDNKSYELIEKGNSDAGFW